MPRYLHILHTPDTARTQTLSGRNCLVVSGIVTPPKIGYRRRKGRRGEMCTQGTQKSHSGAAACLVAYLCVRASHIALPASGNALDVPHIALPARGNALDVPHIALPARGKALDVPHIALPARGNALDVPHIALPACGKALDVPHIALPARGNAPRCTPHRAPCTWGSPPMCPTENDILTQLFNNLKSATNILSS